MKLFNIKKDERKKVLILFVQFFAVVATSITGGTARDAFFLNLFDRSYLPLMFVAIAITMVIVINFYKRITDGKDIIQVISVGGLIFATGLLIIQLSLTRLFSMFSAGESIVDLPEKWLIPVLFVLMEVIVSLSILQFWMLAGEVFDARQAKRLFSIIGAGGSVAGILAGYSLKPFVKTFGSDKLLYLTVFFIVLYVFMGMLIKKRREEKVDDQQKGKPKKEEKKEKVAKVAKQDEFKPISNQDDTPPTLNIEETIIVNQANYEISGKVIDEGSKSDKIYIKVDNSFYPVKKNVFKIPRFSPVDEQVLIVAIDQWGNETSKTINVKVELEENTVAQKLEALNPSNVLGPLAEIFKTVLGAISG